MSDTDIQYKPKETEGLVHVSRAPLFPSKDGTGTGPCHQSQALQLTVSKNDFALQITVSKKHFLRYSVTVTVLQFLKAKVRGHGYFIAT